MVTARQALGCWRRDGEPTLRAIARSERRRARNRWYDLRAALAGYCNRRSNTDDGEGGGYPHWRCDHRRGHEGPHRGCSYVWGDDGVVDFQPLPVARSLPTQLWHRERHMIRTRRGERPHRRHVEALAAERRRAVRS